MNREQHINNQIEQLGEWLELTMRKQEWRCAAGKIDEHYDCDIYRICHIAHHPASKTSVSIELKIAVSK